VKRVGFIHHLDGLLVQEILHSLFLMLGRVVPVKEPLSRAQLRPLVLVNFQKVAGGLDDVVGIDSLAPRDTDGVQHPLFVKEVQNLQSAAVELT
jgi:hypothetical protein